MAHSVQDRFARYLLVERRYINTKEAVLITLVVVAEIDLVPDGIVKQEKALTILLPVLGGAGQIIGAVFEHDF